ncbi:hypothetical protein OBBRIDRAFT_543784 [Obba rivulosa]|uniref:Uncharacterized protein n=1 Tax=Obba rivulosa TaxID=1052685 RepID=A0A8E2AVQ3_9APHY|nr:hypothetical protein OBBRIDRAFT_543784 [Obba rivulosa]
MSTMRQMTPFVQFHNKEFMIDKALLELSIMCTCMSTYGGCTLKTTLVPHCVPKHTHSASVKYARHFSVSNVVRSSYNFSVMRSGYPASDIGNGSTWRMQDRERAHEPRTTGVGSKYDIMFDRAPEEVITTAKILIFRTCTQCNYEVKDASGVRQNSRRERRSQ